jgi:acetyltransferase-like isoleucine patch superfamily enzyme
MTPTPLPKELSPGTLLDHDLLKAALRHCGHGVRIYHGCRLTPPDRISVGDFSQIDEGVRIFGGEQVVIGRHVHLAFDSTISGGGTCEVGDFAGISAGVRIITGTEEVQGGLTNPTIPAAFRKVSRSRVRIGAHALLFTQVVVLPGVTIGEGAVVGAGGIVHRDLKPWRIYAGNPLVCIGPRDPEPILAAAAALGDR